VFARRRDQNVLVFLALAPNGSATRTELQKAFWPGLPASVAAQGVRTTLCRLRRAIAVIAGPDVDRYFASRGIVTLDLAHVRVDARRFREHVQCALLDEARGENAGRIRHFRAAERIYAGSLLASESIDPALAPRVAEYVGMFDVVSSGLAQERRNANRPATLGAPGLSLLTGLRMTVPRRGTA
jgi:DNA-binding SARP family transcriptional activator